MVLEPPFPLIVVFPVIVVVPPFRPQLWIALAPPSVSVPASILIKLVSTEEVRSPPRTRFPLVGVSRVSVALQAMLRLTVCVMGVAGLPLKPRLPLNKMSLPFRLQAPAAASKVRLLTVRLDRSLLFVSRVLPAKVSPMGKTG